MHIRQTAFFLGLLTETAVVHKSQRTEIIPTFLNIKNCKASQLHGSEIELNDLTCQNLRSEFQVFHATAESINSAQRGAQSGLSNTDCGFRGTIGSYPSSTVASIQSGCGSKANCFSVWTFCYLKDWFFFLKLYLKPVKDSVFQLVFEFKIYHIWVF